MNNSIAVTTGLSDHFDRLVGKYDKYASLARSDEIRSLLSEELRFSGIDIALDIGTGTGNFGSLLKTLCPDVFGIDLNYEMLCLARKKGITPIQALAERLPFRDNTFDVVTARQVFQYLTPNQLDNAVRCINGVLKKTGLFILDQTSASSEKEANIVADFMSVSGHKTSFLDIQSLAKIVELAGFTITRTLLHEHTVYESAADFCDVRNISRDQYAARSNIIYGENGFKARISDEGIEYTRKYALLVARK